MIDKWLLPGIIFLMTLSLVMSYSLSVYTVLHFHYEDFHFFIRQGATVVIGLLSIFVLSRLNPDVWFNRVGFFLFFVFFIMMFAMQMMPPSMVKAVGGAKRWIDLGPFSIAPVEFFKVGFVFFLSWSFARKMTSDEDMSFLKELRLLTPYLIIFGFAVVLIAIFQKDLGQTVVLAFTLVTLFVMAGRSMKFFLVGAITGTIGFVGLILMAPHRMDRVLSWWATVQDPILALFPFEAAQRLHIDGGKEPYQISNSLNAIYNGGFFGQGLGNGQFKLGYVSEVHTDFVLAGIAEELGFIGIFVVVMTYLFIIYRLNTIAASLENNKYALFVIGVALLIALSLIVNSYGISGMTPIKGIAVPFLSYGGSQIWANCVAIGMVLMVSKKRILRTETQFDAKHHQVKSAQTIKGG